MTPKVQPLSHRHRNIFFYLLFGIFIAALPFLFLYASGYRFYFDDVGFVSTGGLYVAADKTGAQIFINDELVRETRVFRRAFYAQGLDAGTHEVHVQKEGYHTWTKELPVYPHLVTEAQAFNLPLIPEVRVITPWRTSGGVAVLTATSSLLSAATVSNQYLFEPRAATSTMFANTEFDDLLEYFAATGTVASDPGVLERMQTALNSSLNATTTAFATTTKEWRGVRLYQAGDDVYATYVGNRSTMPYYYCAESFPPYQPAATTTPVKTATLGAAVAEAKGDTLDDTLELEVQTVKESDICDPTIRMDRGGEEVDYFDFFPNSTDLVVMGLQSGVYLVEIDDRAWQNRQPLLLGTGLEVRVINGGIYVYDGRVIYQIQINQNWF